MKAEDRSIDNDLVEMVDVSGRPLHEGDQFIKIRNIYPGGPRWATAGTVVRRGKRLIAVHYHGYDYHNRPPHRLPPSYLQLIRTATGIEVSPTAVRGYAEVFRDRQLWWTVILHDPRTTGLKPAVQIQLHQSSPESADHDLDQELRLAGRYIEHHGWRLDGSWEVKDTNRARVSMVSMSSEE